MCVVSMVYDRYKPYIPPADVPIISAAELRQLLDEFREAIKAAQTVDRLTGQPDCADPDKAKLEERVTKLEKRLDDIAKALGGSP